MKKLQIARNLILIAGMIVCFFAFGKNPYTDSGIEVGTELMFVGFLFEVVRAMIAWP